LSEAALDRALVAFEQPLDPWKPDIRHTAQQALFVCAANPRLSFVENLSAHEHDSETCV
jgi:hypothetical protein